MLRNHQLRIHSQCGREDTGNCESEDFRIREKAGGRYAVGFSLRLPARLSGSAAFQV
jgi:hypothetical protein